MGRNGKVEYVINKNDSAGVKNISLSMQSW